MTKLIFLGCLSTDRYEDTCQNAIKLINFIDPEYKVLNDAPCCGSLSFHVANDDELDKHQQFVNKWFKMNEVTEIITICAGCYGYLSQDYKECLGEDFNVDVKHLVQFINKSENLKKLDLKYSGKKMNISYHDACHLRNGPTSIIEEPRNILNSIEGDIQLKEMENNKLNTICCGSGGGVYSIFKENSDYNSKTIFNQTKRSKALITACPFCFTALNRIREENKIKTVVIKFEDFIMKIMEGVIPIP